MKNSSEVTPVIGVNIHIPTSGDVHLFPDPATYRSKRPIYYADCEGLQGGNRKPTESAIQDQSAPRRYRGMLASTRQLISRSMLRSSSRPGGREQSSTLFQASHESLQYEEVPASRPSSPMLQSRSILSSSSLPGGSEPLLKEQSNIVWESHESRQAQAAPHERLSEMQQLTMLYAQRSQQDEIEWADRNVTREKLVATLYPRVLFTLSDIVVFVSKELRCD